MAVTRSSDLSAIQNILIAEAEAAREVTPVMANLVHKMDVPEGYKEVTLPTFNRVSASSLTEGTAIEKFANLSATTTTVSTSEIGLAFVITDKARRQTPTNLVAMAGRLGGNAVARKVDEDLLALLDGFSKVFGTGSGTTLSAAHIRKAYSYLQNDNDTNYGPAPEPIAAVVHPWSLDAVIAELAPVGTYPVPEGISGTTLERYFRGRDRLFGIPVFADANLTVTSDAAKGGVFSRDALVLATSQRLRRESARDALMRADVLVLTMDYAVAELVDAWGCELNVAAAEPS